MQEATHDYSGGGEKLPCGCAVRWTYITTAGDVVCSNQWCPEQTGRARLGDNHPIVTTVIDVLIVAGVKTRADAATALDNMPPSYGTLTPDERAAVLSRFDR